MPLFVADFLSATSHLDAAESGAYLLLIMHYWQKGSLPKEDRFLARISRMTERRWATAKPTIQAFFAPDWSHERVEKELAKAQRKTEARTEAGFLGGTAKSLKRQNGGLANDTILLDVSTGKTPSKVLPFSSGLGKEDKSSFENPSLRSGSSSAEADDPTSAAGAPKKPRCAPPQADLLVDLFVEGYDKIAVSSGLARVRAITNVRRSRILARAVELVSVLEFETPEAGFAELFSKIRGSPLLLGQVGGRDWKADFDWIINQANFLKIMEGKYAKTQQTGLFAGQPRR